MHSFQDAETRLGADKATILVSSIKCAALCLVSSVPRPSVPKAKHTLLAQQSSRRCAETDAATASAQYNLSGPLHLNPPHFALCRRAVDWVDKTVKEEDIACDWQPIK